MNSSELSVIKYEEISEETLQSLSDKFDLLAETKDCDPEFDVAYAVSTNVFSPGCLMTL